MKLLQLGISYREYERLTAEKYPLLVQLEEDGSFTPIFDLKHCDPPLEEWEKDYLPWEDSPEANPLLRSREDSEDKVGYSACFSDEYEAVSEKRLPLLLQEIEEGGFDPIFDLKHCNPPLTEEEKEEMGVYPFYFRRLV